jgi:fructose-1,6-bisphosphatase/inositol monophosphatase family enzyme
VLGVPTYFLDGTEQADLAARAGDDWTLHPMPRCAAEQYPRLVLGVDDAAIFRRSLPWDHAAGALFLTEAGGVVRQLNGSPYRIGDPRDVMIAAASEAMWERAVGLVREDA